MLNLAKVEPDSYVWRYALAVLAIKEEVKFGENFLCDFQQIANACDNPAGTVLSCP